jgi:hypothetical protein
VKVTDNRDEHVGQRNGYHWFRPHDFDAPHNLQGNGDPVPNYGIKCPYGKPGDTLWVRETWGAAREFDDVKPTHLDPDRDIFYQATDEVPGGLRWRPSIHMPRWASRLALDVASVHVERLQEITTEAIIAEGVDVPDVDYSVAGSPPELESEREAYALRRWIDLWDGINGAKHPWPSNPFVWVVEFKRTEQAQ